MSALTRWITGLALSLLSISGVSAGLDYGQVDPTYAPASLAGWDCAGTMSPLPDDSVLVPLRSSAGQSQSGVARIRPDGTLETSWQGGVALLPHSLSANFMLPLPDGGAVVVGSNTLTRLRADGSVDTGYGINGVSNIGLDTIFSAALQADGSVVVYGEYFVFAPGWYFEQVDPDGTPQLSHVSTFAGPYAWSAQNGGSFDIGILGYSGTMVRPELIHSSNAPPGTDSRVMPRAGAASWTGPTVVVDGAGGAVFAVVSGTLNGFAKVELVRFQPDGTVDAGFGRVTVSPHKAIAVGSMPRAAKLWRSSNGNWTVIFDVFEQDSSAPGAPNVPVSFAVGFGSDGKPDPVFPANQVIVGDSTNIRLNTGKLMTAVSNGGNCQVERLVTDDEPRVDGILIEYFHPLLRHYFLTLDTFEAAALDADPASGWTRTGRTFPAWQPVPTPATTAVCRFYGDPVIGPNSHFYTPEGSECDGLIALQQATPPGQPAWHLEGKPFRASLPSPDGTCPGNLDPVYRVFNGPVDNAHGPTHRYTTDPLLYSQMQSLGWLPEGVHFCVPPLGPR